MTKRYTVTISYTVDLDPLSDEEYESEVAARAMMDLPCEMVVRVTDNRDGISSTYTSYDLED